MARRASDPTGRLIAAMYGYAEEKVRTGDFLGAFLGVGMGDLDTILSRVDLTKNEAAQLLRMAEARYGFIYVRTMKKRKVYLVLRPSPDE